MFTLNSLAAGTAVAATCALLLIPGPATAKSLELPGFTGVTIDSSLDAKIVVGGPQAIEVAAKPGSTLDKFRIEVVNGRLHAWVDRDFFNFFSGPEIDLTITVPALTDLDVNAGSQVVASGMTGELVQISATSGSSVAIDQINARRVVLDTTSGADLVVSGTCDSARAEATSGSHLGAAKLHCGDLDVTASSGAGTQFFATGHVNADASSGAQINLFGPPNHVDDETGSGGDVTVTR